MRKLLISSIGVSLLIYLLDNMATGVGFGAEHYIAGLLSILLLNIIKPHFD